MRTKISASQRVGTYMLDCGQLACGPMRAKRMVMRRCPEWTDHNVSDPGVTLIETFAYLTDQLLFRLNRVPDRLYLKFLDLEMAGPLNEVVKAARSRGVFIIHAPSSVTAFYKDTPQRKLAHAAPFAKTPVALSTDQRWGTAWCWPDKQREPALPIDDSDMGCDCAVKCKVRDAWTRQIATIELAEGDAMTDDGQ